MFKRLSITLTALALIASAVVFSTPARAQDKLKYGDSVDGEVAAGKSVSYIFTGKKDDVVIFQVIPLESDDGSTLNVKAVLSDAKGTVLINASEDYSRVFVGAFAKAFFEILPADGDYTLTLAGDTADTKGKFTLQVFQPDPIAFDQPVSVSAKFKGFSRYLGVYTIPADQAFTLIFTQEEGDSGLSVSVLEYSEKFLRTAASADANNASEVGFTLRKGNAKFYFVTIASPGYTTSDSTLKFNISAKLVK